MTTISYPHPRLSYPLAPLAILTLITLLLTLVRPIAMPAPAPLPPPILPATPYARADSNVFIENRGQFTDDLVAALLAREAQLGVGRDGRLYLAVTGAPPLTLTFSSEGYTPQPQVTLTGPLATRVSFLTRDNIDRHQANVPVWAGVRIAGLIPQLALELTVEEGRLRLRATPDGAPDLGAVRLRVEGATVVGISDGTLEVQAGERWLRLPLLEVDSGGAAYLPVANSQLPTPMLLAQQEVGAPFAPLGAAGQAHSSAAPASVAHLLAASTFLGSPGGYLGNDSDTAAALALDAQGNVYVAGEAGSADFPIVSGAYDSTYNFGDAFIVKLSSDLTTLIAVTFLGGSTNVDQVTSVAVDVQGNVYVAGETLSSDFPTTAGAYDTFHSYYYYGDSEGFITKLSGDLATLLASTFLGGSRSDRINSLALDTQGNVYVAGETASSDFPHTSTGLLFCTSQTRNTFVTKLSSNLNNLLASSCLSMVNRATSLALDAQGNVYVGGYTEFPGPLGTPGAYDPTINHSWDAFIAKLSNDLNTLVASTFLGAIHSDMIEALVLDAQGNVYVAGRTDSPDFPTTPGAYQSSTDGTDKGFISKLNSDLATLLASTVVRGVTTINDLVVDAQGNIYMVGSTGSTISPNTPSPTTPGAFDQTHNGESDALISKLNGDLTTLLYSTFLGGSGSEGVADLELDTHGNVYVAGSTGSIDFPITSGAFDQTHNGGADAFISKLNGNLSSLSAATFLGGSSGRDKATALALDTQGNVYVAGETASAVFPTGSGALDTIHNGSFDAFIAKMSGDLTSLITATFLGGSNIDKVTALTFDPGGNLYATGITYSADFPTTQGAFDPTHNGSSDIFVARLSSDLNALSAATFLGGNSRDEAMALALDIWGNVYVAGETYSANFPVMPGAFDTAVVHNEGFIARLSSDLTQLSAATFFGGVAQIAALALDTQGNVYVAGSGGIIPTTPEAFDTTYNGSRDAFVAKLNSGLTDLLASTYLGGGNYDWATALALDDQGNIYVGGYTDSADFPTTAGAYDPTHNGWFDAFIARLSNDLSTLAVATFIGGSDREESTSLALDTWGNVYVAGTTSSADFPTTPGAVDEVYNGSEDVFIARLNGDLTVLAAGTFLGGSVLDRATALALDPQGTVYVAGETKSVGFPTTPGAYDRTYNGGENTWEGGDAFIARLTFTFAKVAPSRNATGQPTSLSLQWNAIAAPVNHYRYCIATTVGCTPTTSVGTATSVAVTDLTRGATYHWQVRACLDSGCSVYIDADNAQHHAFTVATLLSAFSKTAPANNATGQHASLSLQWQAAGADVNHYRYCIATTVGCTPTTSVGTATSVAVSGLAPRDTYYWQVRACADSGCAVYLDADNGQHHSFTVAAPPPSTTPPEAVEVMEEVISPNGVTLSWSPVSGQFDHYRYCIAPAPGCTPAISVGTATSVTIPLSGDGAAGRAVAPAQQAALQPGQTYYWLVRACADSACTVYTDANNGQYRSFIVRFAVYLPLTVR